MKPISPRLLELLLSSQGLFVADTYRFTLVGGGELLYTTGDADLVVNGLVYSAGGVMIGPYFDTDRNKGRTSWKTGSSVDQLVFDVIPGDATVLGQPFLPACQTGTFDGATLIKQRLFMPTYGDTRRGPITIFSGRVAEVDAGRSKATFMVNAWTELLDQYFPRNLFGAGCVNNLGDTACGVNLSALAVACVALTGSTSTLLSANLTVSPTGNFNQGKITFTSGVLDGVSRSVKYATAGTPGSIALLFPLPSTPANGDTFDIYPGCDKQYAGTNGCLKFANQARWRGADLIPTAETAI